MPCLWHGSFEVFHELFTQELIAVALVLQRLQKTICTRLFFFTHFERDGPSGLSQLNLLDSMTCESTTQVEQGERKSMNTGQTETNTLPRVPTSKALCCSTSTVGFSNLWTQCVRVLRTMKVAVLK